MPGFVIDCYVEDDGTTWVVSVIEGHTAAAGDAVEGAVFVAQWSGTDIGALLLRAGMRVRTEIEARRQGLSRDEVEGMLGRIEKALRQEGVDGA